MKKLTEKQQIELEELERQRKERLTFDAKLDHLRHWLEDGYKECEARDWVIEALAQKGKELCDEADAMYDLIMLRRREFGID